MSLDIPAGAIAPALFPLQFVNIEITPLIDGQFSVVMQATQLDEEQLEFVGRDLACERVDTLDQAISPSSARTSLRLPLQTPRDRRHEPGCISQHRGSYPRAER
jgi:hypothetical protein